MEDKDYFDGKVEEFETATGRGDTRTLFKIAKEITCKFRSSPVQVDKLGTTLNNELGKVSQWLIANKLSIKYKENKICHLSTQAKKN